MKEYVFDENTIRFLFKDISKAYLAGREHIVRCADCKYAGTNDCVLDAHVPFKQDAFCSWGDAR